MVQNSRVKFHFTLFIYMLFNEKTDEILIFVGKMLVSPDFSQDIFLEF
jgi:hypothetical protein